MSAEAIRVNGDSLCFMFKHEETGLYNNNIKVYIYDSTDKVITMDSDTRYGGTCQRICMITSC